jgi:hypothetical protein
MPFPLPFEGDLLLPFPLEGDLLLPFPLESSEPLPLPDGSADVLGEAEVVGTAVEPFALEPLALEPLALEPLALKPLDPFPPDVAGSNRWRIRCLAFKRRPVSSTTSACTCASLKMTPQEAIAHKRDRGKTVIVTLM